MLFRAVSAVHAYVQLSATLLGGFKLDPKLRELAVLRVTYRIDARYAWVQHVALARLAGLDEDKIAAVQRRISPETFTTAERLVLALADCLVDTGRPSDALFDEMQATFLPHEIIELLLVVGWYWTVARLMTTLDMEPEPAFADEGVLG
jgi:alkylhydroperoxidase family enzyme